MAAAVREPWLGTPPGRTTAATVSRCTRLRRDGDWRGACLAAGFQVDLDLDEAAGVYGHGAVPRLRADLGELVPDLLWQYLPDSFHERSFDATVVVLSPLAFLSGSLPEPPALVVTMPSEPDTQRRPRVALADPDRLPKRTTRVLPAPCWRAGSVTERRDAYTLPEPYAAGEVAALRDGTLLPDDLHPLVHDALYPDRVYAPVAPSWQWPVVRVRCGAVWHEVRVVGGRLDTLAHDDREIDREFAFGGLGGAMGGCAAAAWAWRTGTGRLPRRLRWQRTDFFRHARYGHTDDVLAMLDAGFDIAARDGAGATLMHYLGHVDYRRLWPRLRAVGLPVDARDHQRRTPLRHAVALQHEEVVALLLDAGADPHATDTDGNSPITWQERYVETYRRSHRLAQPLPPSSILARLRAGASG